MSSQRRFVLSSFVACGACAAFVLTTPVLTEQVRSDPSRLGSSASMVDLVAKVIPSVVSIEAYKLLSDRGADAARRTPQIKQSVGSGFVVDPSGYIATNKHVVDGAYEIAVTFATGRTVDAKLVFKSTVVDVAFLKVDLNEPLPSAVLSPNQKLQVGQRVFAVGNPLALGISVSAGIVSALDRNIKESPYDAFIQTDAAINHGSSGGPLFNEVGEVIGINTALFSSVDNGGSQGLGFAIPGRDIVFLIDNLKRYKSIHAGWIGANTQKLTADMSEALGFPGYYGVIVATVTAGSPAAAIGLQPGDIITSFDDEHVVDATTLSRAAALSLGKHVVLGVWRKGAVFTLPIEIQEAEQHGALMADAPVASPRFATVADMGLTLSSIDPAARSTTARGLRVTGVAIDSVAEEAGIKPGDTILSAQMASLESDNAFEELILDQARKGHRHIIVLVRAPGGDRWVSLPLRL